jgi:ketosteroid isomerase-like protein
LSDAVIVADNSQEQEELKRILYQIFEDAENKNIEALKASHLVTPKFSKFGPRALHRQDAESTNQSEAAFFSSVDKLEVEITDPKVDVFGNVAIVTFYADSVVTYGTDVKSGSRRGTLAFARTKDGWKIVHEHSSPYSKN